MKSSAPADARRHSIVLVTDDDALGDTVEHHLAAAGIEVTQVHDSIVAPGVIKARPEAGLLLTEIAVHPNNRQSLALTVRCLSPRVGIVFMTTRSHLIEAPEQLRRQAFVKLVDLSNLASEIRYRLAE